MAKVARLVGVVLAMLAIFAGGCRVHHASDDHAAQQIMYSSMVGDPRTFNPVIANDLYSATVVNDIFDGLIRINPMTALPEPGLAESWEIASDQKSITFHLRHGVNWMDGKPFTSHDVAFTMKVMYDKRVPNSARSILQIDGKPMEVETPDDYTVTFRLPRPFAPLMYSIGFAIIPAHILEPIYEAGHFNQTWNINTAPKELVGLGPYQMTRYVPAQMVQYSRNPDFWMKDDHGGQLPRLRGETTLIVPDQNAGYLKFLSGQTDMYGPNDLHPDEVVDLRDKAKRLNIAIADAGVDNGELFFSFNRNPRHYVQNGKTDPRLNWFSDINFLRAIAHSIDKKGMISLCFHGMGIAAVSEISPANKIFYNPNLKDYDFNLQEAAQLLEAAGYHLLRPGVRVDPKGNLLEFNLMTSAGVQLRNQMCAIFKQDLAQLGIKVNYRPLEFTTMIEKIDNNFDWDCVLIGFTGTIDPNGGANFLNSAGPLHIWNPGEEKPATPWEAEIDKLLEQGTAEMDIKKRVPYYWRIQEILHDQLPVIETVLQIRYVAYTNKLENVRVTPLGIYRPEYIQFKE
jgi:peptide/nickel transport system substrate-binding protein